MAGGTLAGALAVGAASRGGARMTFHSAQRPASATVAQVYAAGLDVARRWAGLGVRPGDPIAVQAPNWYETAVAYFAAGILGALLLPIVPIYGPREVGFILRQSRARLIVLPTSWRGVDASAHISAAGPLPDLRHVVTIGEEPVDGAIGWQELGRLPVVELPASAVRSDDPAVLVYTSGTTADPKGVLHSGSSLLAELANGPTPPPGQPADVSLQPFPAGHTAGLSALLGPVVRGTSVVLMDAWDPSQAVELIARHGVTSMAGTPFHVRGILDEAGRDVPPLRHVITGGADVPVSMLDEAEQAGWRVSRCYGATELPSATWSDVDDPPERRHRTDGKAQAGNEVRIMGTDGSVLPPGNEGEVLLRGPELFAGYLDSSLDAEALGSDGWFRTGDIGHLDEDGYLTISGRAKDVVIRGGENISSAEVEELLRQHPAVADAAVVAAHHDRYGEQVCAFVTPRPGASLSLDEVREHFEGLGVAKQKTPERLEIVTEMPRTPAGKVRKAELRSSLSSIRRSDS